MNKKVLLTGVSGYIGLHCAKTLLENGYNVIGSVRTCLLYTSPSPRDRH